MSTRFVPETTTSPDWTCWVLYDENDEVLGSVLTSPAATVDEAREKMVAEMLSGVEILAALDRLADANDG